MYDARDNFVSLWGDLCVSSCTFVRSNLQIQILQSEILQTSWLLHHFLSSSHEKASVSAAIPGTVSHTCLVCFMWSKAKINLLRLPDKHKIWFIRKSWGWVLSKERYLKLLIRTGVWCTHLALLLLKHSHPSFIQFATFFLLWKKVQSV